MRLNLGCGKCIIPGYVNADIIPRPGVNVVCDARHLPFPNSSIELIYASAILEHLGRHEWRFVLKNWALKLRRGGILRVSTPDFRAVCEWYLETGSLDGLLGLTVGGQRDEYDRHGMVFDYESLEGALFGAGFDAVRRYDWRDTELGALGIDDFSQAYLPHMDKENGRLMNLNLEAERWFAHTFPS